MIQRGFDGQEVDSLEASVLRWDLDHVLTGSVSAYLDSTVYEWDLDADGFFDDGIGSVVSHMWFREGDRLIALKVTNTLGYSDVGYTRVRLGSVNDGPLLRSAFPEDFYVDMVPLGVPVRLAVFDVTGREIATLVDAALSAGTHRLLWNACDRSGRPVPQGVYWFRLQSPKGQTVAKAVLVR